MPASTFQSESFQKMLVIGVQAKDLHLLFIKNYYKVMEKNSERGYCIPLFRKTKRIMKITTLFSLGVACCISASTYAQNYKVSINKQNSSIIEILREIEKSSEFTFFFNDNRVNVNKTVSVNAQNAIYIGRCTGPGVEKYRLQVSNYRSPSVDQGFGQPLIERCSTE